MINFDNILFLDIETVAVESQYQDLSSEMQVLWNKKASNITQQKGDIDYAKIFVEKGAIYSEFGKVVTISLGKYSEDKELIKTKSFCDTDEKKVLINFIETIEKYNPHDLVFCGHNIKEFDIPYLCRRILINGLKLPSVLQLSGKKPWEIKNIDTMEMWSFGDKKSFTSLNLLTTIFRIDSSKSDIDGSDVHKVFYEEKNFERLKKYCANDVIATINLFLKMKGYQVAKSVNNE